MSEKCPNCENELIQCEFEFGINENEFGEIVETNLYKCDLCKSLHELM